MTDYGDSRQVTMSYCRSHLAEVVDDARVKHDPVYLTSQGRRMAAVIDADDLDILIEAAEDLADIRAAAEARADIAIHGTIPWEQVKAELGFD